MVDLKQLYKGVELYYGRITVNFSRSGKLNGIGGGFSSIQHLLPIPSIDSNSAVGIVKQDLKLPSDYKDTLKESRNKLRELRGRPRKYNPLPSARLVVYAAKDQHRLAWVVMMPMSSSWTDWEYIVDAHTGQIVHRENTAIWENHDSPPSEKPRPVKENAPPNPPVEKYEWPYPPRIETVKTAPQIVPELYQKMQDSLRKLEEKAWEEEARQHKMSPAQYLKYREEEEIRRSLEAAREAGVPEGYQPAPGGPREVKRPVPPDITEARKPVMSIDSPEKDSVVIKVLDPSEIPESLRIEWDKALELEKKRREGLPKIKEPRSEEETSSNQLGTQKAVVQTAFLYDAFWVGIPRDCDGDNYYSQWRLAWDPGLYTCGTGESLLVYEKLYYRTGSNPWAPFEHQPDPHYIVDCYGTNIQTVPIVQLSGPPSYVDFRIEIYRSGQTGYDHYRDPFNDPNLYRNPFETVEADQCFRAKIHNAWWEAQTDCDFDGYVSSAQLRWDPDVIGYEEFISVYEKVYQKPASSSTWSLYSTTNTHTVNGCGTFDFQAVTVQNFNQGLYDWKIEIYRDGQSVPDTSANPSNDPDLNDKKLELSGQDVCAVTIVDAWWTGTNDCDRDGYYSAAQLNWNPNVGGCGIGPLQVYEKIYYKPYNSGTWTLFYTTSSHTISGCSNADAQSLVIPDNIHPNNFYDWKIEIYPAGETTPGYVRDPGNDPLDLNDYPMETVAQDPCAPFATIENAWWTNEVDCDDDGYKSVTRLNWNPEVLGCVGQLTVYEWIWRKEVGTSEWFPAGSTNNHTITGCSGSDIQVKDYVNPIGHKLYDWKIEIYRVNEIVPDYVRDYSNDLDLGNYGIEAISLDPCLQPDLACYNPADWESSIVVANQPETDSQSQPTHTKYAYIDFAVINQ
ncbi:MAG: choice-of-anchor H family protein, partial [candidate division Zixibacteria bacterium]|nr:choice-of-anchor H family protein [candidate division Zixibacteria bacterium]